MASRWVSNYLRHMHEPQPFQWLRFPGCLEALPWSKAECLQRVPPAGRYGQHLTPYGLVWLGLLASPPFFDTPNHQLRAVPSQRRYGCRDRNALMYPLVDHLLGYEVALTDLYDWKPLQAAMEHALIPLSAASRILQNLKAQHLSPEHEVLRKSARQVLKGYQWLERAVKHLTARDYARGRYPPDDRTHTTASDLQYQLIYFHYEAWMECVPTLDAPIKFTKTMVYQFIASVLTHMVIHHIRQRTFTAEAIRKALQRTEPLETRSYLWTGQNIDTHL